MFEIKTIIAMNFRPILGEPINITIPLSGAPTPEVEWTKGTVRIPPSNRVSTDMSDEKTIFRIEESTRGDGGVYTGIYIYIHLLTFQQKNLRNGYFSKNNYKIFSKPTNRFKSNHIRFLFEDKHLIEYTSLWYYNNYNFLLYFK